MAPAETVAVTFSEAPTMALPLTSLTSMIGWVVRASLFLAPAGSFTKTICVAEPAIKVTNQFLVMDLGLAIENCKVC